MVRLRPEARRDCVMTAKQWIAAIAPPVLIGVMVLAFRLLSGAIGRPFVAWSLGLALYWLTWCTVLPMALVGWRRIRELVRPTPLRGSGVALFFVPLVGAALYRLVPGIGYEKRGLWMMALYASSAFGNGFFEELLWRGVYLHLFPDRILLRMVWPTLGFALWHYAPSVASANENVWGLIIGAGALGFVLSLLARQTNSLWWPIAAHTIGGLIMVL